MPNIKIIGGEYVEPKKLKPIELIKILDSDGVMDKRSPAVCITRYKNIELISKNYTSDGLDLIFCYDDNRNNYAETSLFLGHWNDGVI